MGKMGGYELNVSSDIDLIFVFPEAGDTNGKRPKSNVEFFTKVGQKTILNDITAEGQVFRVDMRLRPDGDSGVLVLSEAALERICRSRARMGTLVLGLGRIISPGINDITSLVRPFVYRKYLDFDAYEGMFLAQPNPPRSQQKKACKTTLNWELAAYVRLNSLPKCFN